jgi:hypothetical protein
MSMSTSFLRYSAALVSLIHPGCTQCSGGITPNSTGASVIIRIRLLASDASAFIGACQQSHAPFELVREWLVVEKHPGVTIVLVEAILKTPYALRGAEEIRVAREHEQCRVRPLVRVWIRGRGEVVSRRDKVSDQLRGQQVEGRVMCGSEGREDVRGEENDLEGRLSDRRSGRLQKTHRESKDGQRMPHPRRRGSRM